MPETLKPCPFCGGKARLVVCDSEGNIRDESYEADPYSGLSYAIVHGSDDCCGECPISTSDLLPWLYETREEAAAAWNRRAERTCRNELSGYIDCMGRPVPDQFRCSVCGEHSRTMVDIGFGDMGSKAPRFCPNCGARVVSE